MWFPISSLYLAFNDFAFFKHSFYRKRRLLKRVPYYLFIFVIRKNEILIAVIRDSLFFLFVNRARDPPVRPSKKVEDHNNKTGPDRKIWKDFPWNGFLYWWKSRRVIKDHTGEQQHCRHRRQWLGGKDRWWKAFAFDPERFQNYQPEICLNGNRPWTPVCALG